MTSTVLETAQLQWKNTQTPVSSQYDDVYFSADDGLAESHFVFIENNDLTERFQTLTATHFTIAETGFGTGLNFLQTWQLWKQYRHTGQKLYYLSVERFPLKKSDLKQSLACWPQFRPIAEELYENYPEPIRGLHCIELSDGVTLLLMLDEAVKAFSSLIENSHPSFNYSTNRAVDAWFLDGFAPAKNPDMWTDELFLCMAKLSRNGTSFSSFTAAGIVRRGLQAAGFEVFKVKGFGKKREMIRGQFTGRPLQTNDTNETHRKKTHEAFWPIYRRAMAQSATDVLIIGAGIAGVTTALALEEAGMKVTIVDSNSEAMKEASGNPQGVLFPKLSHEQSTFSEFNLFSLLFSTRYYQQEIFKNGFIQCGMLQIIAEQDLLAAEKLIARFNGLEHLIQLVSAETASEIANTNIDRPCLWFPQSGWLKPSIIRQAFQSHNQITFKNDCHIQKLIKQNSHWQAHTESGEIVNASNVIIANAFAACQLLPELMLPAKRIRGQITRFDAASYNKLHTVICHDGYICPVDEQSTKQFTCGASYELHDSDEALKQSSQDYNLQTLKHHLRDFHTLDSPPLDGRVNFRCSASDYLPMIGPIPDTRQFAATYQSYAKNGNAYIPTPGPYIDGLFLNIGYGSRGFSSAPICAALLRAYILEQPYPLPFAVVQALNPARFLIRDIIRKKYVSP